MTSIEIEDREDKHSGHGQNTCYRKLRPSVHLQVSHYKYWDDSDGKVGSHADDTIGNWRSDYEIRVATMSLGSIAKVLFPVEGWGKTLKHHYEEEEQAVSYADRHRDIDNPLVHLLEHDP